MDPNNPEIWGQITLLRKTEPVAAYQALKEAIKLKLTNTDLLLQMASAMLSISNQNAAWDAIEQACRSKMQKDNMKQLKKVEEFLKANKD